MMNCEKGKCFNEKSYNIKRNAEVIPLEYIENNGKTNRKLFTKCRQHISQLQTNGGESYESSI